MTGSSIKGLILDLDGVIIDSEFARDEDTRLFLAERGKTYDRDRIKPLLAGKGLLSIMQIFKDIYSLEESAEELTAERRLRVRELYRTSIEFVPGFLEAHSKIRLPMAIATGCDYDFYNLIDSRLHITQLFDGHVYHSRLVAREKPEPDIFIYAAGRLGISPKECAYVDDAPFGILGAKTTGGFTIALRRTFGKEALYRQFGDDILYAESWEDPVLTDLLFPL